MTIGNRYLLLPAIMIAMAPGSIVHAQDKVEIILANFSYTPAALHLKAGRPVTLHFVNKGSGGHDFTAPEFFAAATMDAATRKALAKGKVALDKGSAADVTLVPVAGHYAAHCSHFLHTGFGMKGTIDVE